MSERAASTVAETRSMDFEKLDHARQFDGEPAEFWVACLEALGRVAEAEAGVLALRDGTAEGGRWKKLGKWTASRRGEQLLAGALPALDSVADAAAGAGTEAREVAAGDGRATHRLLGVRLDTGEESGVCVAVFLATNGEEGAASQALARLRLAADTPRIYRLRRLADRARQDLAHYAAALDLVALLNNQHRFVATAMTFCNELATRYECSRVSLGWLQDRYVRLQAVSHIEKFERKMDTVNRLEQVMEEALEQDEEIVWPPPAGAGVIARDHERFARDQGVDFCCSIPVRVDHQPVGVVTCERATRPFDEVEVRRLRLSTDLAARRLGELRRHDRWFGARWCTGAKEALAKLVGVEHTGAKLLGIVGAGALLAVIFGQRTYRVEAPFTLRTENLAHLSAPFDGYIDAVHVRMGDEVEAGAPLLALDVRELLLEEASARADHERYVREAEKAEADSALAEMRIALALADQAQARLDLLQYRLGQATIRAPFAGVIVEGDLRERIGAPVRQGDILFKVARAGEFYVECAVAERDIHEVKADALGQIAFASQPHRVFPIRVDRIEPAAVTGAQGNTFIVRSVVPGDTPGWWRPGMTGVSKLNAGRRSLLWIFTHRTVDFLRLWLWW